jgi:hypothetical protein
VTAKLHTVHVRVNDAATGQPMPCRVRFTDAEGRYYAPFGRLTEFQTSQGADAAGNLLLESGAYAYIDGACEIDLPAGPITIEIHKGPEYLPLRQTVPLGQGKLALRFSLERWIDLRKEGWHSGDTCVHFLSPRAALMEGTGEDVAVVNLLAMQSPIENTNHGLGLPRISNILDFSGQTPATESPGHIVLVNTRNLGGVLGSLLLLNCHRVVYPLAIGEPGGKGPYDWTMADWCGQCHRKGGLVLWALVGSSCGGELVGEGLANAILQQVDALGISTNRDRANPAVSRQTYSVWYHLLNCGFRLPITGGSLKQSPLTPIGAVRTYAQLQTGAELTYSNWIEAVRAGRTFVTDGPLLRFTVNDEGPGNVVDLPAGGGRVRVRAEVRSLRPMDRLEIVVNGQARATASAAGMPSQAVLDLDLPQERSCWIAARAWSEKNSHCCAHTSPVYVQVADRPMLLDKVSFDFLMDKLTEMLGWVEKANQFGEEKNRERLASIFRSAKEELLKRALV